MVYFRFHVRLIWKGNGDFMMYPYCELHCHSTWSDGKLSPDALVREAKNQQIGVLAITDHNTVNDLTQLRQDHPDIHLIQGTEASSMYTDSTGETHQTHFVGLGFDPNHPRMVELMKLCNPDRTSYNQAQLDALLNINIDLGTLEEMRQRWEGRPQLGTRQFAEDLVRFGYAASVPDAYDRYLGRNGTAYVKNPLTYPDMEQVVQAILAAGGIPVLAHLFYYGMNDLDNHRFVGQFRELTGDKGAMETEYAEYTPGQCERLLKEFARPYGLMESCASDFHGVGLNPSDHLGHRFPQERFRPLLERVL